VTILGLKGELQLLEVLQSLDFKCIHRLEKRKINDFLTDSDPKTRKKIREWFRRNRMLPRDKLTYQVDLLAWKRDHWAALAVEQKNQYGARKILEVGKNELTLKTMYKNNEKEYKRSAKNLFLQCLGESYLGKAYCLAKGMENQVIPVGVLDYDIKVNSGVNIYTDWVYHHGVFFVQTESFKWFLRQYLKKGDWIKKIVKNEPKLAYPIGKDVNLSYN